MSHDIHRSTETVSDCCSAPVYSDHGICSRCGEHCTEMSLSDGDYIPGLDDGEGWDPVMGSDDEWPETDDDFAADYYGEEDCR